MKFIPTVVFSLLTFITIINAQQFADLSKLKSDYELFNYKKVIAESERLLLKKEQFETNTILEIFTLIDSNKSHSLT